MRISAIIPCLNEEPNIKPLYERASKILATFEDYEFIFIDNGSTDQTLREMKALAESDNRVKFISFARTFSLESEFRVGYQNASFEWIVQLDGDLQSPPEEIVKLAQAAREKDLDCVFGIRINRQDQTFHKFGSHLQHWVARNIFRINMPMGASLFRLVKTTIARQAIEMNTLTPYFIATIPLVTRHYALIPTEHNQRRAGRSKWRLFNMLSHSFELFFGFSALPLAAAGCSAIGLALCGIILFPFFSMWGFSPQWLIGPLLIDLLLTGGILSLYLYYIIAARSGTRPYVIRETNIPNIK